MGAVIADLSKPTFGFSFTVDLEVGWTVVRAREGAVLFRKSIKTSHTVGAMESFAGVTRLRLAVEGAARKNIESFIADFGGSDY